MGSRGWPPDIETKDEQAQSRQYIERETLALSQPRPGVILQTGQPEFSQELANHFDAAENNALEELVLLKRKLGQVDSEEFWSVATEGMAVIAGAEYSFISKRVLVDDQNKNVEMPPLGTPGSCLMASAFYYNDFVDKKGVLRNWRYASWDCPCAYMKHDKVLVISSGMQQFIINNPNADAHVVPAESYIGVPLFHEGKCFAHFGLQFGVVGEKKRKLSWTFLEMMLHSLEDIFLAHLLQGKPLLTGPAVEITAPTSPAPQPKPPQVIPHEYVSPAQSFKPYARSLSHELRTPMQGVVGMLDIMHATVQETVEGLTDLRLRKVLETLRQNIEVVQDSSRRAVDAADNIVHAYDMNMGVDDSPFSPIDEEKGCLPPTKRAESENRPFVVTGNNISFRGRKRAREDDSQSATAKKPATERSRIESRQDSSSRPDRSVDYLTDAAEAAHIISNDMGAMDKHSPEQCQARGSLPYTTDHMVAPGLRHTDLRDVIQYVVNDSLKVGGRPESAIARQTDVGEHIEVRHTDSSGTDRIKTIEWAVDPAVPDTIMIDEKDLAKMISCVFLNAVKFTERGPIVATANLSPKGRYVIINIKDSGPGIPEAFLPNLFKPFSREDHSLTRQSEGLGLGLLVAKGLARKLGGNLHCARSETKGPNKGCDFEIRVPLTPGDVCSRPGSQSGSPTPSVKSRRSAESDLSVHEASPRAKSQSHLLSDNLKETLARRLAQAQSTALNQPMQLATPTPTPWTENSFAGPNLLPPPTPAPSYQRKPSYYGSRRTPKRDGYDRCLAQKYPLKFLVVEDNKINRKLLVTMLQKFGYRSIQEAYDGADAVRQMEKNKDNGQRIDVILMDLWMPFMDGYEAAQRILQMDEGPQDAQISDGMDKSCRSRKPTILAVTADVTDGALERAAKVGMKGFMTKPYRLLDLERLIVEYCAERDAENGAMEVGDGQIEGTACG